jgi:hypothetical protein
MMPKSGDSSGYDNKGPHLFFSRIQHRDALGVLTPLPGVSLESLPLKTGLRGLDNAYITFESFSIPRADLLSAFSEVQRGEGQGEGEGVQYVLRLPPGNKRMLDLLLARLLTGRVCLSEYTVAYARVFCPLPPPPPLTPALLSSIACICNSHW